MITLKANNTLLLTGARQTNLLNNYISSWGTGSNTIALYNVDSLATDTYILVGNFGSKTTEILKIASVDTTAKTIVTTTATKFAHAESTTVSVLPYNQVVFYWTATDTYSTGTPIGSSVDIQADDLYTRCNDATHSSGYGWFIFNNATTAAQSSNSNAIPYGDFDENSAKKLLDSFFSSLNNREQNLVTREDALRYMNEAVARAQNHLNLVNSTYHAERAAISTLVGTAEYDLPTAVIGKYTFGDLLSISDSRGLPVKYCEIWDVDYWNSIPSNQTKYYLRGKKIGFTPTPQVAMDYSLIYKDISNAITSLYTTLDFPDNNFYGLLDFMLYRACPKLGRTQAEATGFLAAFNDSMNFMKVTSVKQSANGDSWTIDRRYNV